MLSRRVPASHLSDQEIRSSLLAGGIQSKKAEAELFNAYSYFVQEGIRKYALREDESFDAYADAIISTISSVLNGSFEQRSSLKTYIFRVFNNKCVDVIRKNTTNKNSVNRTMAIPEMLSQLSDPAKLIIQELTDKADYEDIKRRVADLGDSCKSLLMMFAEGYTDRQIAEKMNYKTPEVVKTSRLRCLQKLRQAYSITKES